ncbi:MAG: 16S rRNA (uracil(1498)-N(3))-methyltransferase [Pseudomonadota bacterium]
MNAVSKINELALPEKARWRHLPRFYVEVTNFNQNSIFALPQHMFQHAIKVRRLKMGQYFIVFDGAGIEYLASLQTIMRSSATAYWHDSQMISRESSINVCLVMGLIASEKMDWVIQKATELGVTSIQPILTQHSFQMAEHRFAEKERHWNGVVVAACEQSGRNILPSLQPLTPLTEYLTHENNTSLPVLKWLLSPFAEESLASKVHTELFLPNNVPSTSLSSSSNNKPTMNKRSIRFFIGPEGGFSENEENLMRTEGCIAMSLGERILRAETAAIAALSQVLLV